MKIKKIEIKDYKAFYGKHLLDSGRQEQDDCTKRPHSSSRLILFKHQNRLIIE